MLFTFTSPNEDPFKKSTLKNPKSNVCFGGTLPSCLRGFLEAPPLSSAQGTWHPVLSVPTGPWPANGGIGGGWESSSVIRLRVA